MENIKKALDNLPPADRWGTLMWDEISLKKDVTWHSTKLEWHGIVDFGDGIESKAMVLLHNNNAIVKSLASDGCTSNKAAMRLLGICGKVSRDKVKKDKSYFNLHPLDTKIKIYWLTDVPHLLKCTRNNILKHGDVQVNLNNLNNSTSYSVA